MLILQNLSYIHPNKDVLFDKLNVTFNRQHKIALIGNNGIGKSTLLKIMAGTLVPAAGVVKTEHTPYYIPQLFGQFNDYSIAQALRIEDKLNALKAIENGEVSEANLNALGRKKQEKAGVPTIMMKTMKNNAEKSTARVKDIHAEKTGGIAQELTELRKALPDIDKMKFGFDASALL